MHRVLKPGGCLILGTPDYAHWSWVLIEALYRKVSPGGYCDEHITQYSLESLTAKLKKMGFRLNRYEYILNSELILSCVLEN